MVVFDMEGWSHVWIEEKNFVISASKPKDDPNKALKISRTTEN